MKIKQEKQLTLPQLIEWGFGNDIREKSFIANEYVGDQRQEVHFNAVGIPKFSAFVQKSNTFTVEVREEITEDTVFKSMVEVTTDGLLDVWGNANISAWKDVHSKEFHAYIDGEFKLVWRNGKLVE